MQLWLTTTLFLLTSFAVHAQPCPRLEGTFRCRASQPFDIRIENGFQDGFANYTMTDPTETHNFVADGQTHEMNFRDGNGRYVARCQGNQLVIEAQSPRGEILRDHYYIERAALVRIRFSQKQKPSSISCAPTHGTWRLYPR